MAFLFPPPATPALALRGRGDLYPVARVFCVGRNYAAHAAEMGQAVDRDSPIWFAKSATAVERSPAAVPYPPGTQDFHHEVELVAALGAPLFRASAAEAAGAVWGYACGLDMTRRDLQLRERARQRPWTLGKDVERSAVIGALTPAGAFGPVGAQRIALRVNGAGRQDARLSDMVFTVPELLAHLSGFYHLGPGDVVMTGTPEGVGPVVPGDVVEAEVEGCEPVRLLVGPPG